MAAGMRGRLFLKIYLTVLGAIAVLALAGALTLALLVDREDRGWLNQRAGLLVAALSGPEPPQAVLDRIGPASQAQIDIRDQTGRLIAAWPPMGDRDTARPGPQEGPLTLDLPGGGSMTVTARFSGPLKGRLNPPLLLLLFAALTALAAWPVVRNLTRRLERLRHGVESWGEGNLSLRVPVEGRDEIAAVADSFNRAAAQVEAQIRANRALLANASHELRSPLARLRMAVDLSEDDPTPQRRAEITRNLAELDELVSEILLSSRLTHAAPAEPFQRLDLLALAAEEAALAGLEVGGVPVEVMGDARLLSRAIRNLIQNAQRHGAPPVDITVARQGDRAVLTLRDHGPGIPAADLARVFEPFYRPGGHGEAAGGWGLGLALVRQITERHAGTVQADHPPGGGARIGLNLPCA